MIVPKSKVRQHQDNAAANKSQELHIKSSRLNQDGKVPDLNLPDTYERAPYATNKIDSKRDKFIKEDRNRANHVRKRSSMFES